MALRFGLACNLQIYWSEKLLAQWESGNGLICPTVFGDRSDASCFAHFDALFSVSTQETPVGSCIKFRFQDLSASSAKCFEESRSIQSALYYGAFSTVLESCKTSVKPHRLDHSEIGVDTVMDVYVAQFVDSGTLKMSVIFPSRAAYRIHISSIRLQWFNECVAIDKLSLR